MATRSDTTFCPASDGERSEPCVRARASDASERFASTRSRFDPLLRMQCNALRRVVCIRAGCATSG